MNWDLGLFETTVGTSAYQSGHRFPSCAEYIAANPSPENNDGTELWVGAMIDEDIPRMDNTLVDNRTAVAWADPLADDDGYSGDNAYSCLHSRVYAVAEEACRADGARVCTQGEIEASCGNGQGCGHSTDFVWTSTECTIDTTLPALQLAQQLVMASAEFHMANENQPTNSLRPPRPDVQSQGRDYKATVLIYLDGGLDSFNMLVPVANCAAEDLY